MCKINLVHYIYDVLCHDIKVLKALYNYKMCLSRIDSEGKAKVFLHWIIQLA